MSSLTGAFVTESFAHDGGRDVTVYVPPGVVDAVVFAADGGWHVARLARALETAGSTATMLVGVHGADEDSGRFGEYVVGVDAARFAEHEAFLVEEVRSWVEARFGVAAGGARTAIWGASLGGELALAMGVRHPDVFGAVLCASPGAGYRPPR